MIILVGNCQIQRLQWIFRVNGITDFEYYANTDLLDANFDAALVLERVACGSVVIAQPILNPQHPLNHQALRSASRNVIFVPYVFLDGLFCMSVADAAATRVYGEDPVLEVFRQCDMGRAVEDFRHGRIPFNNSQRLARSMAELMGREQECCDVHISDVLQECLQDRLPMVTHNHPAPFVFDLMSERIFSLMGLKYIPYLQQPLGLQVDYTFSLEPRCLSPYDVDALQLRYPPDQQWFNIGFWIIRRLHEVMVQSDESLSKLA